ncbi:unnamed protein product [Rotaria socialis]|uniref:Protein SSUH2 homolog n=1 Tax=Rotaria socialis TaxID=392032 RepID=A0A820W3G5_9BILA|nr:unnamed protein product [Rotaria socialis]CAF3342115.1 unnamed protein product [Rotaria socialis]CAF3573606.1 unnamed protein product [Rotaria socialis]CAF4277580.1 unnamed protein product [Rotaria socialis]CAF4380692.1 unnamed protein product [Rotaria socialis]
MASNISNAANEQSSHINVSSSEPITISECSVQKTIGPTGSTMKYEITTNKGIIRASERTEVSGPQIDNSKQISNIPIVAVEDDETEPSREVATANPTTTAIVPRQSQIPLRGIDFVPIPMQQVVSLAFPIDPYSFDHFRKYIGSKLCYNAAPLDQSKIIKTQERVAYRVDIWTLMENRTLEWTTKPYRDEDTPNRTVGNIFDWDDISFDCPRADVEGIVKKSYPLEDTQAKIVCGFCRGQGAQKCAQCYGQGHFIPQNGYSTRCLACNGQGTLSCVHCDRSGFLLKVATLKFEWESINSVNCYQNTFLPDKLIRLRRNKPVVFDGAIKWNSSMVLTNFPELIETLQGQTPGDLSDKLIKDIQKQYLTHYIRLKKPTQSNRITKIKCLVRQVDVIEIDYRLDGYINKVGRNKGTDNFTYLVYGVEDNGTAMIYENDYPINCCGCIGSKGCRCNCTIS